MARRKIRHGLAAASFLVFPALANGADAARAEDGDELDQAILLVHPGAMDFIVPVARLWDCLAQSSSNAMVIRRTALESYGEQKNYKITLRNSDGKLADMYFAIENNKALLFRIQTSDGVLRKQDNIAALIADTCHFDKRN